MSEEERLETLNISLIDLLIVIAKRKVLIAGITIAATGASTVISLLLPNIYTSTATVLPPQQHQSAAALLLGQLGNLSGLLGGSTGIKNPNELYVGMLRSRTIADSIIEDFKMQEVYETETMVETREALANHSRIAAGRDGLITVEVDDEDPKRAAAIANAYVEQLEKLTQSLAVTEAAQRRLFFERQLQGAKENLAKAEIALKGTQEKTGLIRLDEQGRAIIEAVASLRGQIAAKEIELRSMQTFATKDNPDYVRAQQQLSGLRVQLAKLERSHVPREGDVMLPTGQVPEAGLEYLRRFRDVKYYETMFELLAKQYEIAKIDEAKDAGIVQVVDRAAPPDRKSKPRRALIVMVSTLIAAACAVLLAFFREAQERAAMDPVEAARLETLRRQMRLR